MSALTLMSVSAPVIPNAPQGSSAKAASGFQSFLAALSGEAGTDRETGSARSEAPQPDETQTGNEADASTVTGLMAAPVPATVPVVLPAAPETTTTANPVGSAGADRDSVSDDSLAPPVTADDPDGVQSTTPLLVDKTLTYKPVQPEVQPPAPGDVDPEVLPPRPNGTRLIAPNSETQLTVAETEAVEAHTRTATAAVAATGTNPQVPVPAPAPLRPLAERTSRPVEASTSLTGEGTSVADPARPSIASLATAPATTPEPPARPVDLAPLIARDSSGGKLEEPTSGLPATGETTTGQTQASGAAKDTLVSQLSRGTIEATAQIAAQIQRRLEGRSTRFEMALTPDELGRVDVKLDIDSEGRLNARLAFDNPAAATDLRGRADELRRQLEAAGFQLADDAFEFADRDSGSSAFDRGQDTRNGSSRAFAAATRLNTEIDVAQPPLWLALSLSPSGVDMKV